MRLTEEQLGRLLREIGCEDRLGDIFLYADDPRNLNEARRTSLERHLEECQACAKDLGFALSHLRESAREELPSWLNELEGLNTTGPLPSMGTGLVQTRDEGHGVESVGTDRDLGDRTRWSTSAAEKLRAGVAWVSSAWKPVFAGVPVTAADVSDQSHVFISPNGDILISCRWRGQQGHRLPHIRISWRASIKTRRELHARFVNPETEQVLAEIRLGSKLEGETTVNSRKLGFDPSTTPWCLQVVLR